jgi:molybdopterin biosynthesis enzyme MoaB
VVEARKLSDSIQEKAVGNKNNEDNIEHNEIVQSLDAMGYDEAAQYVYGMMYPEWKKRHAQKASDEKMEQFNNSKSLWATHDKQLLTKRGEIPPASSPSQPSVHTTNSNNNICKAPTTVKATATSLLSNVCCEDIDNNNSNITSSSEQQQQQQQSSSMQQVNNNVNTTSSFVPPIPPNISFSLGVLTVSDRAFNGNYDTGDLSGPAVIETIQSILNNYNNNNTTGTSPTTTTIKMKRIETAIVQDEIKMIQDTLINWSSLSSSASSSAAAAAAGLDNSNDDDDAIDLIVTTGGTGFSPRDVTPEATTEILERACDGLMSFCTLQCVSSQIQPLASLSRGTAGVRGQTLIVNLPGNPFAIKEILPILLPLSLHAIADMKKMATI